MIPLRRLQPLLVLALLLAATAPAHGAVGCDATGDATRADDCVRHEMVGAARDGTVARLEPIMLRQRVDPSLRGVTLVSRIQVRRAPRGGPKGSWLEIRRVRWTPGARGELDIRACRANLAGRYEFRTVVTPTAAPRSGLLGRAVAPLGTSAASVVTLPASPANCYRGGDDLINVSYLNENIFVDAYQIAIAQTATGYTLSLACPEIESAVWPFPSLAIALALAGQRTGVGCDDPTADRPADVIPLAVADLQRGAYPECRPSGSSFACDVAVIYWNAFSGTVYGTTDLTVVLTAGSLAPTLNPAALPECLQPAPPCILNGTCNPGDGPPAPVLTCTGSGEQLCVYGSAPSSPVGASVHFLP